MRHQKMVTMVMGLFRGDPSFFLRELAGVVATTIDRTAPATPPAVRELEKALRAVLTDPKAVAALTEDLTSSEAPDPVTS